MEKLEEQKERLSVIFKALKNEIDVHEGFPKLEIDQQEWSDNEGNYALSVGDDSEIRYEDGKFYRLDYHDEEKPKRLMTETEIIDYYLGLHSPYGCVPIIKKYTEDKNQHLDSYHYCLGFIETMESMLKHLKEDVSEYEEKNNLK